MKKNILIIIISIIIVALGVGFFIYTLTVPKQNAVSKNNSASAEETEISGTKDIEGVTHSEGIVLTKSDKTEVNLDEYKNKPMMLLFFNKENEDSIKVLKKVEEMYKNYEEKVNFFMINTSTEVDEELENEYTLEIYYDFNQEVAKSYNVEEVPATIYIDELNKFLNAKTGFTTTDALEANLDILSGNI